MPRFVIPIFFLLWSGAVYSQGKAAEQAGVSYEYKIAVGDTLNVFVWRNPELSVAIPVRPDGRISLPLIDDLVVAGKTPKQLSTEVEGQLERFIKQPEVSVMVMNFGSNYQRDIKVIGNTEKILSVPYSKDLTLLDVLVRLGGISQSVAVSDAKVIRAIDGGRISEISIDMKALLMKGKMEKNILMSPGDVLLLPERWF